MTDESAGSSALLARLEELAARVGQQEAALARLQASAGAAPVAAGVAGPAAVTGRRAALRRLLVAGVGAVGLLATAREARPAHAEAEGNFVQVNTQVKTGVAGYPHSTVVYSTADDNIVAGVLGLIGPAAQLGTGSQSGVHGVAAGGGRIGVQGRAVDGPGVFGYSPNQPGVFAISNNHNGVYGQSSSATNPGVRGVAFTASDRAVGVLGDTSSPNGTGVMGFGNVAGTGVRGFTNGGGFGGLFDSPTGFGAFGTSAGDGTAAVAGVGSGPAYGVVGSGNGAAGVLGQSLNPAAYAGQFIGASPTGPGVYVSGNLVVTGSITKGARTTLGMTQLHAVGAPEALFEDVGTARLQNGRARVELDATFAEMIAGNGYQVFLTPHGAETKGLAVTQRDAKGFTIQEAQGGAGSYQVDWRVVGKQKDAPAGQRLKAIEAPKAPKLPDRDALKPPAPPAPPATEPGGQ